MKNWVLWLVAGIFALVGGFFALSYPLGASVAVSIFTGWVFLLVGVVQGVAIFQTVGIGPRIWAALLALLAIFAGISLLANPMAGLLSLTLVLAIIFLFEGIAKIIMSFPLRRLGGSFSWWILLSGVVSILLSVMIFADYPQSATVILGVLLAINLISTGVSLISVAFALKKA